VGEVDEPSPAKEKGGKGGMHRKRTPKERRWEGVIEERKKGCG